MQTKTKIAPEKIETEKKAMTLSDLKLSDLLPMAACVAFLIWLYGPTFAWWYRNWMAKESYYSHGILVPIISAGIIWLKRQELSAVAIRSYPKGFFALIPLLLGVIVVSWAGPSSPLGLTVPLVIAGVVMVLFGPAMVKELRFPIGYLYFMCVLPGFLLVKASFRIQMLSTISATEMLKLAGFDAYREGVMITLPNIEVMVGAPCSGFRLLISLVSLAVLFVFFSEGPKWGKAVLLALTLPMSVVLNSFRIALIALVGEFMGSDAMHAFHDWSGYIMLVLSLFVLYLLAGLVKCRKFNSMLAF